MTGTEAGDVTNWFQDKKDLSPSAEVCWLPDLFPGPSEGVMIIITTPSQTHHSLHTANHSTHQIGMMQTGSQKPSKEMTQSQCDQPVPKAEQDQGACLFLDSLGRFRTPPLEPCETQLLPSCPPNCPSLTTLWKSAPHTPNSPERKQLVERARG